MTQCSKCGKENKDTAKFCTGCRTKLGRTCPQCGAGVPPEAKFCTECGTNLKNAAPATSQERNMQVIPEDDEFYGENLNQVETLESGETIIHEVKVVTSAIMTWWKVRMKQQDIIDIARDDLSSSLSFEDELHLPEDWSMSDNSCFIVFEADEKLMISTMFVYSPLFRGMDMNALGAMQHIVLSANVSNRLGVFEILFPDEETFTVRYKFAELLDGVRVGKVNMIEKQYEIGKIYAMSGFNGMLQALDE